MDYPIYQYTDSISMDLSILYLKGSQVKILRFCYISVPEDYFYLCQNSPDPDEMPHCIRFHQALHCLTNNEKG